MLGGEDLAGADVLAFASPWLGEGSGQGVTHHKLSSVAGNRLQPYGNRLHVQNSNSKPFSTAISQTSLLVIDYTSWSFYVEKLQIVDVASCRTEIEGLEEHIVNHEGDIEPTIFVLNGLVAMTRYLDMKLNKVVWSHGIRSVSRRIRVRIAHKGNNDEDAKEELYSLVIVIKIAKDELKGLGTKVIDDED
ncbi:60S ribosomal protein L31 [Glycine soja]|uniref:60S ribosomal protein L31 n=1 Tax=Glycine soja TaxID=3848 RepID=A0A445LA80_GLYSO|nr:60S ribosomal protein L31 [Glycine soja]